jgi:hypothetical protein
MRGAVTDEPDSGYPRLEQQITWYDTKSGSAQRWFKRTRFAQIAITAAVPVAAYLAMPPVTAALAGVILVLETIQQLNQWQHNWITYRSTCEALRHEKYTYLGRVGPYDDVDSDGAKKVLVERVESLISTEHSKWVGRLQNERKEDC